MQKTILVSSTGLPKTELSEERWRELLAVLIERYRRPNDSGDMAACRRLQPKLVAAASIRVSWSPNYILGVLHGNKGMTPSPVFTDAVETLAQRPPRRKRDRRKDRPRLYIPFANKADIAYIKKHLSLADRRDILLAAAARRILENE